MRKTNAILSIAIIILFLIHGVLEAFNLIGTGYISIKLLTRFMLLLVAMHTVIGIILTAKSVSVWRKSGAAYFGENKLFWIRRISGFTIMLLIFFHVTAFGHTVNGTYVLNDFNVFRLTCQLLLAASAAVHIISNIKPLMIALGRKSSIKRCISPILVLSVLLLFMAAALVIYYVRWQVQ